MATPPTTPAAGLIALVAAARAALSVSTRSYPGRPADVRVQSRARAPQALLRDLRAAASVACDATEVALHPARIYEMSHHVVKPAKGTPFIPLDAPAPDPAGLIADCRALVGARHPTGLRASAGARLHLTLTFETTNMWISPVAHPYHPPRVTLTTARPILLGQDLAPVPQLDDGGALDSLLHAAVCRWFARSPLWFAGVATLTIDVPVDEPTAHERAVDATRLQGLV